MGRRFFSGSSAQHRGAVAFVFALGVLLRLLRLDGPVTYDEAFSYLGYAGRSFGAVFSDYTWVGNHILYSALARLSTLAFGIQLWSLRLPALIAGILVMPLLYTFVRSAFNRHMAVVALCLVAVSGPLVEYSALGRGYSLTWCAMVLALYAGRHFVRSENTVSAGLMALSCALGMWATPTMLHPALMCFFWTFFMVLARYRTTVRRRVLKLVAAFLFFIALTVLFHLPVILMQGLDQWLHHPSYAEDTWARFTDSQQDRAFELWAYFTGTASTGLAVAGAVAVTYAAWLSMKYRALLFALALSTIPVVLVQHRVEPPAAWTYVLFILHLGTAIALYHLLKNVHDRFATGFSESKRTWVSGIAMLLLFGWTGLHGEGDPVERFPEAASAATWAWQNGKPGDRFCAVAPWDAPVIFEGIRHKVDQEVYYGRPASYGRTYLLVAAGDGQTPENVAVASEFVVPASAPPQLLATWGRLCLYTLP